MRSAAARTGLAAVSLFVTAATATTLSAQVRAGQGRGGPPTTFQHGTWSRGPGTYEVTVCASGCTINGDVGHYVSFTVRAWGAGGGGGSAAKADDPAQHGRNAGGGGGYSVADDLNAGQPGAAGTGLGESLANGTQMPGKPGVRGVQPSGCDGGAGGAGAGIGVNNNGGAGGSGGYYHHLVAPTCTAKSDNYGATYAGSGGNGLVRIDW